MQPSLSPQKWQQFLGDVQLQWRLRDTDLTAARNLTDLTTILRKAVDLPEERVEMELQVMMLVFRERIRRAA